MHGFAGRICCCRVFTLENIAVSSFSNIYKVAFTACPCFLASNLFRNIIKQLPNTLCHMARSIRSTCLLARAQGNETVLYAIWQTWNNKTWNNMFCAFAAWNMEKHVLFVLVKHLSSVPLLTLCLSCLQGEASQNSTAKKTPTCKNPSVQRYLDGRGAPARQLERGYPRCAACTAAV